MEVVFIVSRFPYPLEKGDKLRAYQHLQNMKLSGFNVHLIALSDKKVSKNELNKILLESESRKKMLNNYSVLREVLGGTGASKRVAKRMYDYLKK